MKGSIMFGCKHVWKEVSRTKYVPMVTIKTVTGGLDTETIRLIMGSTTVILACDKCGKTKKYVCEGSD